eukprot:1150955-Pelagomonas_calceolata.AAC.2
MLTTRLASLAPQVLKLEPEHHVKACKTTLKSGFKTSRYGSASCPQGNTILDAWCATLADERNIKKDYTTIKKDYRIFKCFSSQLLKIDVRKRAKSTSLNHRTAWQQAITIKHLQLLVNRSLRSWPLLAIAFARLRRSEK